MRFLLYPQRVVATAARQQQQQQQQPTAMVVAWGQQCSPTCGCVVRFERSEQQRLSYTAKRVVLTTMSSSSRPEVTQKGRPLLAPCHCTALHHLSTALVNHYNNSNNSNNNNHPHSHHCDGSTGTPKTTRQGRLFTDLEFQSTRSSRVFSHAVLQSQGLLRHSNNNNNNDDDDTHPYHHHHHHHHQLYACFDVVEEAWTALVKGYLPAPRRRRPRTTQQDGSVSPPIEPAWRAPPEDDDDDAFQPTKRTSSPSTKNDIYNETNDEYDEPRYWMGWSPPSDDCPKDYSSKESNGGSASLAIRRSSTLYMFDWNQQQLELQQKNSQNYNSDDYDYWQQQHGRQPLETTSPADWQAYVDQQYADRLPRQAYSA
jgi:hypothetical protein